MDTITSFEIVEIPVKLCKRGRKVDAGRLLRETRMSVERSEFEPDNSRIGCESSGLQAFTDWYGPLTEHQFNLITAGFVPTTCKVTVIEMQQVTPQRVKLVRPPHFGERVSLVHPSIKSINQSKENVLCQNRMKPSPRQGQRPVVLTSKNSLK